jgi:hypothetical protein
MHCMFNLVNPSHNINKELTVGTESKQFFWGIFPSSNSNKYDQIQLLWLKSDFKWLNFNILNYICLSSNNFSKILFKIGGWKFWAWSMMKNDKTSEKTSYIRLSKILIQQQHWRFPWLIVDEKPEKQKFKNPSKQRRGAQNGSKWSSNSSTKTKSNGFPSRNTRNKIHFLACQWNQSMWIQRRCLVPLQVCINKPDLSVLNRIVRQWSVVCNFIAGSVLFDSVQNQGYLVELFGRPSPRTSLKINDSLTDNFGSRCRKIKIS